MSNEPREEIYNVTLRVHHPNEKLEVITNALGLQPDYKWQAGQPRRTPIETPLPGINRDTYWAFPKESLGTDIFSKLSWSC